MAPLPSGRRRLLQGAAVSASLAALPAGLVRAQAYPSKPIKIMVGFTPGGLPDITARLIAQRLGESWKQSVTVENRPGAGGNIAAQAVALAPPDGYTLLSITSAHTIAPAIYPKLPFDTLKDFSGVTMTGTGPCLLIVAPDLPAKTVAELIALARAKPGALNFSSAGIGSGTHFAAEAFKAQTGIDVVHVPMKGIPEAIGEVMAGRVQFFMAPFATVINLVREGRVRAIAVTSPARMSETPNIPTVSESGAPGYKWAIWSALLVAAKTPRPVITELNREIVRILKLPETGQRLQTLGTEASPSTPEELDKLIGEEVATYTRMARAANIKVE